MKRIICFICALLLTAAVLAGCSGSNTRTVVTDSGTTINVELDKLTFTRCIYKINDGEKAFIDGDKVAELFKKVDKLHSNELTNPETGDNHVELTFVVPQGHCGHFVFYDNGVMSFSPSPKIGEVKWYAYNKDEYNNILDELK